MIENLRYLNLLGCKCTLSDSGYLKNSLIRNVCPGSWCYEVLLVSAKMLAISTMTILFCLLKNKYMCSYCFLIQRFKNAGYPVCTYFRKNKWWLNLVTYVHKCVDFLGCIRVTSIFHFLEDTILFIFMQKTTRGGFLLNLLRYKCNLLDNAWGIVQKL